MKTLTLPAFGEKIRQIRKQKKVSQAHIARELGCSRAYVNKIELGKCNCTVAQASYICALLGVRLEIIE